LISISALALIVVVAGVGSYLYFFSGLHSAPKKLALATPSPIATTSTGTADKSSSLTGDWQVTTGSLAGYRAVEKFVSMTSNHDAVSRTSDVTGKLALTESAGNLEATGVTVTVQLAGLKSVDSVAGFNVANRDRVVGQDLDVTQYPTATFTSSGTIELPAGVHDGQVVNLTVPGTLSLHGESHQVNATLQAESQDGQLKVAGSIQTDMTDYGVQPPQVPFVTVQPDITVEFQLNYVKS
jgi:polyisoprenoid-binding protein YceI